MEKHAQRVGLEQAERYIDLLTAAFDVLAESPKLAPACDHIRLGYRRRNIERHMIYFRVTEYGIAIIRVLREPGGRDLIFACRPRWAVTPSARP